MLYVFDSLILEESLYQQLAIVLSLEDTVRWVTLFKNPIGSCFIVLLHIWIKLNYAQLRALKIAHSDVKINNPCQHVSL